MTAPFRSRVVMLAMTVACWTVSAAVTAAPDDPRPAASLPSEILDDPLLTDVLSRARNLLRGGLNAGAGYDAVWIRDLNTFIDLSIEVGNATAVREALLTLCKFQSAAGDIPDGFVRAGARSEGGLERESPLVPGARAHKNTVETDQEASFVQAVRKYVSATNDWTILGEQIDGRTVLARMGGALEWVYAARFDASRGLVWGATTVDWGDVQPESAWGVAFDASSHRAIDIYDNAMTAIAIQDYLRLLPSGVAEMTKWQQRLTDLRRNIRAHLWDSHRQKFVPHVYLDGSPFPDDFDEASIYVHGGTVVAIEAGLLSQSEVARVLRDITSNVTRAGAHSVGLTVYPAYPAGFFKNPSMAPYSYQNGGDWCWFGGRLGDRPFDAVGENSGIGAAHGKANPAPGFLHRGLVDVKKGPRIAEVGG